MLLIKNKCCTGREDDRGGVVISGGGGVGVSGGRCFIFSVCNIRRTRGGSN
jgi:hypothetical protein